VSGEILLAGDSAQRDTDLFLAIPRTPVVAQAARSARLIAHSGPGIAQATPRPRHSRSGSRSALAGNRSAVGRARWGPSPGVDRDPPAQRRWGLGVPRGAIRCRITPIIHRLEVKPRGPVGGRNGRIHLRTDHCNDFYVMTILQEGNPQNPDVWAPLAVYPPFLRARSPGSSVEASGSDHPGPFSGSNHAKTRDLRNLRYLG
jgi:hypothetical protein